MDHVTIPIGKTSKNAAYYANDEKNLTKHFQLNGLTLPSFKKAILKNQAHFSDTSSRKDDMMNLQRVYALIKIKPSDQRVMDREEQRNKMEDLESLIKQTVHDLPVKQKELMYADLKNDFMETLLLPFSGFCSSTLEGSWGGIVLFLGCIVICILFYILCLVWLFYAYVAVTNCGGPTLAASNSELCSALAECNIAAMGAMGNLKSYFTFRLVMYCLSPLSLVSVAISSHFHQRNTLHRLTGLPHGAADTADDEEPKCGKNAWLNFTTIVIAIMNGAMGIVTVTFDVLFLDHMAKSGSTNCTMIVSNKQVGDSSFHLSPSIKDTPIAVLVFNIIYTLWGFFYVGTMLFHFNTRINNGSADLRKLMRDDAKRYRPNYVKEETWNAANAKQMASMMLDPPTSSSMPAASPSKKNSRRGASPSQKGDRRAASPSTRGPPASPPAPPSQKGGRRAASPSKKAGRRPGSEQPPRRAPGSPRTSDWPKVDATLGTAGPFVFSAPAALHGSSSGSSSGSSGGSSTTAAAWPAASAKRLKPTPGVRYSGPREGAAPPPNDGRA